MAIDDVYEICIRNRFDDHASDDCVFVSFELFDLFRRQTCLRALVVGGNGKSTGSSGAFHRLRLGKQTTERIEDTCLRLTAKKCRIVWEVQLENNLTSERGIL